jgi:hypothetical protein
MAKTERKKPANEKRISVFLTLYFSILQKWHSKFTAYSVRLLTHKNACVKQILTRSS